MVTFTAYARANFRDFDFLAGFDQNATFTRSPATEDSTFTVTPDPAQLPDVELVVKGRDFDYLGQFPVSGTIKSATLFDTSGSGPGDRVYLLSGLSLTPNEALGLANQDPGAAAAEIFKGNDKINGSNSRDFLDGFGGDDTLDGRGGPDTFYFSTPVGRSNIDTIVKYSKAQDTIGLDTSVFEGMGADGVLKKAFFKDVTDGFDSQDSNDRILYDSDSGKVYYDDPGRAGPQVFAILENDPVIDHKDFQLF